MEIPYRPTSLTIKQINFDALEEIEKINLQYFFPNYSTQNLTVNPGTVHPLVSELKQKGFDMVRDESTPRRYAGDRSLPRSRYYSVCNDTSGYDHETLINELCAYGDYDNIGPFFTVDNRSRNEDAKYIQERFPAKKNGIFCLPKESKAFPSSYPDAINYERAGNYGNFFGIIPVEITAVHINKLIDLRCPEVQVWFTEQLTNLVDPTTGMKSFPLCPPLSDFTKLLPSLLSQTTGDNRMVTQVAGFWLRRLGVEALIYPSARSNCFTTFENGQLVDWGGWCMVDYRDTSETWTQGFIDFSPEWDEYPTDADHVLQDKDSHPPHVFSQTLIRQAAEGANAGSLSVEGLVEQTMQFRKINECLYFIEQIEARYGIIDSSLLRIAFFKLAAIENVIDISIASRIAYLFCTSIFGNEDSIEILQRVIHDFIKSHPDMAEVLEQFVEFCMAINNLGE